MGVVDAHGVYQYDGTEQAAPMADMLNLAQAATSTAFGKLQALQPFGHMGRTAGFQPINTAGVTVVGMDAAQKLEGGLVFENSSDSLIVPASGAGSYRLRAAIYYTGGAGWFGTASIRILRGAATIDRPVVRDQKIDSQDYLFHGNLTDDLQAGDKVQLIIQATAGSTYGTDGFNGSWLEIERRHA